MPSKNEQGALPHTWREIMSLVGDAKIILEHLFCFV